jgi:hypothetical protein
MLSLNKSEVAYGLPRLLEDTAAPNPEDVSKATKDLNPPTNEGDDIDMGSLLLILWRSNRGSSLVGAHVTTKLRELHRNLKNADLISGDYPSLEDAKAAASCFLKSDSLSAEKIKRQIWLQQARTEDDDDEGDDEFDDYANDFLAAYGDGDGDDGCEDEDFDDY